MLTEDCSTDGALLHGFSSGSEKGFAAFYDRFSGVLFSVASRIVGNGKPAEEVLEDAFIEIRSRASEFDPSRESLFAWAVMITRHEGLRRLRSTGGIRLSVKANLVRSPRRDVVQTDTTSLHGKQERSRARAAFAFLTRSEQEALELCFFDGLTAAQVSHKLGISPGKLGSTVRRGLFAFLHALSNGTDGTRIGSRAGAATAPA